MLKINNINVFYGKVQALFDISIEIGDKDIVSVIGANGAGKTTLMKSIVGICNPASGSIVFNDTDLTKMKTHNIVKKGVVYVPEGRRVFYDLTVEDNLEMGAYGRKITKKEYNEELEVVLEIFPRLRERMKQLGGTMSGGEQQMLAIARGLMSNPKLLMLDEPSLGLAPVIVDELFDVIVRINKMKQLPIVLVEQNAYMAMSASTNTYVLENGHMVMSGKSSELIKSPYIKKAYLGG